MRTTALVVEHLIVGSQTVVAIVFLLASLHGYEWLLLPAPAYQLLTLVFSLLIAYPLGIFIDELADRAFQQYTRSIRKKYDHREERKAFELLIRLKEKSTTQYFHYLRSRIRIARSSVLNFLLLTIASVLFTLTQLAPTLGGQLTKVVITQLIVGLLLSLLAFFCLGHFTETFARKVKQGFELLERMEQTFTTHASE